MRAAVTPNYIFTPGGAGAGTLNLYGIPNFTISRLIAVVDATTSTSIYAMGLPGLGYNSLSGQTLTLQANTSGCASTDALVIIYDDGNSLPSLGPDIIANSLPVVLPQDAPPLNVTIAVPDGDETADPIAGSALETMSYDPASGVRQQVQLPDLVDTLSPNAGIKIADCKIFSGGGQASGSPTGANNLGVHYIIDTTGYQSAAIQVYGVFVATIAWFASNDLVNWISVNAYNVTPAGAPSIQAQGAGIFVTHCSAKYLKVQTIVYTSGTPLTTCTLRTSPMPTYPGIAYVGGVGVAGGGVGGTVPIQGTNAQGTISNMLPVVIAGVDNVTPTPNVRRLLLDSSGRIAAASSDGVLRSASVLAPVSNPQNLTAMPVVDQSTSEGQTTIDILLQVLKELQINNLYMAQLPTWLNCGTINIEEPGVYRNETSLTG